MLNDVDDMSRGPCPPEAAANPLGREITRDILVVSAGMGAVVVAALLAVQGLLLS
jgi:hypothetical protein